MHCLKPIFKFGSFVVFRVPDLPDVQGEGRCLGICNGIVAWNCRTPEGRHYRSAVLNRCCVFFARDSRRRWGSPVKVFQRLPLAKVERFSLGMK